MTFDLHTHSTASDGSLAPHELLQLAKARGVSVLAITDHDTLAGYQAASSWMQTGAAPPALPRLVPGVEISTQWGRQGIHVLGLNVDPGNGRLRDLLASQQARRSQRARQIARRLEKLRMPGVWDQLAGQLASGTQIGRPHIASSLIALGFVTSAEHAFKKYLGNGKPADVRIEWATLTEVVEAIGAAGGTAVLAHPLKYKMTASRRRALLADFVGCGGRGIELISGIQSRDATEVLANLARQFDLRVSCGSDFHAPESRWQPLGALATLPRRCKVVWDEWSITC